jgi:regulatory protein
LVDAKRGRGSGRKLGCQDRALGLLAVRARSRRELESRLLRAGFDQEEVAETMQGLSRAGLVDDAAFAREFATHAFGSRRSGERLVRQGLRAKGVAEDVIETAIAETSGASGHRLTDLAQDRARRLGNLDPAVAYRRLTDYLVRRGYGFSEASDAARRALAVDPFADG